MKESKTLFICAAMNIAATVGKVIIHAMKLSPFTINRGWSTALILDIVAVWLIFNSKVKHKGALAVMGALIYVMIVVTLAVLETIGFVELSI